MSESSQKTRKYRIDGGNFPKGKTSAGSKTQLSDFSRKLKVTAGSWQHPPLIYRKRMKRRQKFADELKWLQGTASNNHHTIVSFEYPAKKPREESQISVTTISKIVSLKRHTNDTHKDTANKPRKELHISVMIRSEITSARFKIWERELSRCSLPANIERIRISNVFDGKLTTHALLPEKCTEQLFHSWSNLAQTPIYVIEDGCDQKSRSKAVIQRSPSSLILVKSEWIVECLKAKAILVSKSYLHQLQCPITQNISDNTVSLKEKEGVTIPSSLYGPSYKSGSRGRSDTDTAQQNADHSKHNAGGTDSSRLQGPGASASSNTSGNQIVVVRPGGGNSSNLNNVTNSSGVIYDVVIPTNKNSHITDILKQMTVFYDLLGDNFREMVYRRCCGVLETHPTKIENINEIILLPGVGKSLGDKISEILRTGSLEKLENFKNDPKLSALVDMGKIWGVGPKGAQNLYNLGYRSVKDLRAGGTEHLTFQQKIGLRHFENLQTRIPRAEVQEIESIVREHAERLVPGIQTVVCGSYRRGSSTCGDVDFLFSPPEGQEHVDILPALVESLSKCGFLTDHLAMPHTHSHAEAEVEVDGAVDKNIQSDGADSKGKKGQWRRWGTKSKEKHAVPVPSEHDERNTDPDQVYISSGRSSYMGVCKVPVEGSLYRRIDMKSYRRSQFPFAIFYFTGPDHFNRAVRNHASHLGYSLSDVGLVPCMRGLNRQRIVKSKVSVPCASEGDIFTALGLRYKEPEERCFFLSPATQKGQGQGNGQGLRSDLISAG